MQAPIYISVYGDRKTKKPSAGKQALGFLCLEEAPVLADDRELMNLRIRGELAVGHLAHQLRREAGAAEDPNFGAGFGIEEFIKRFIREAAAGEQHAHYRAQCSLVRANDGERTRGIDIAEDNFAAFGSREEGLTSDGDGWGGGRRLLGGGDTLHATTPLAGQDIEVPSLSLYVRP